MRLTPESKARLMQEISALIQTLTATHPDSDYLPALQRALKKIEDFRPYHKPKPGFELNGYVSGYKKAWHYSRYLYTPQLRHFRMDSNSQRFFLGNDNRRLARLRENVLETEDATLAEYLEVDRWALA